MWQSFTAQYCLHSSTAPYCLHSVTAPYCLYSFTALYCLHSFTAPYCLHSFTAPYCLHSFTAPYCLHSFTAPYCLQLQFYPLAVRCICPWTVVTCKKIMRAIIISKTAIWSILILLFHQRLGFLTRLLHVKIQTFNIIQFVPSIIMLPVIKPKDILWRKK